MASKTFATSLVVFTLMTSQVFAVLRLDWKRPDSPQSQTLSEADTLISNLGSTARDRDMEHEASKFANIMLQEARSLKAQKHEESYQAIQGSIEATNKAFVKKSGKTTKSYKNLKSSLETLNISKACL